MYYKLMGNASYAYFHIPKGTNLAGYSDRPTGCLGTHDMLATKSLTITNGDETIVIITNDLLSVDKEMVQGVVENINERYSIPEKNIFICASHTHSGPEITGFEIYDYDKKIDENHKKLKKEIINIISQNALKSLDNLVPIKIGFGKGQCDEIACNRIDKNFKVDKNVYILKILKTSGDILALIINYSCHPTVMGSNNLYVTADFAGVVQNLIEKHYKNNCIAMFTNGACGDQSTRYTRKEQSFKEVKRLGNILYKSVVNIADAINKYEDTISMECIKTTYEFPMKDLPNYNEALTRYREAKLLKEQALNNNVSSAEIRKAITRYQGASITLKLIDLFKKENKIIDFIHIIKINKIVFVGLPIELFSEYGFKIKSLSKYENTIIVDYTNNLLGYVYTPDSYKDGDYEAWSSPFRIDTGEIIVTDVLKLINNLED
ncbi:neutral/alkaline non-lysosomal ceramidase N-terminal domain-containing protein [Clostridium lundense]|uniref:neutral/alkaline non-lysosomal ceramidase N-terminal domain-containing protein n=1 Tax=Clostridium lundense TaxID=319475 RepID=UPI0004874FB0|nr:neutral/alkaline non-lysosomal ceramidase N-terminal domain-containing protein [Clostridium lundense]